MTVSVKEWRDDQYAFIEASVNDEGSIAFTIGTQTDESLVCTLTDVQAERFLAALVKAFGCEFEPTQPKSNG